MIPASGSLHIIRTCISKKALPTEGPTAPLAWEGSVLLVILTRSPTLRGRVVEFFFLLDNDCLRFFFSLLSFFSTFSLRFVISGVFKRALLRPKKKQERKKNGDHFALYEDDEMNSV